MPDSTEYFTTSLRWANREDIENYVITVGNAVNVYPIIVSSNPGNGVRPPRIYWGCERSGRYRSRVEEIDFEFSRSSKTKKCRCPMSLIGKFVDGYWTLKVHEGRHNHNLGKYRNSHYTGGVNDEHARRIDLLTKAGVKPREIFGLFRAEDETTCPNIKQIHNSRSTLKKRRMDNRTPVQQLMNQIKEHGYIYWYRVADDTNVLSDVFFAHPTTVKLLRLYPYSIIMDATYKTNRYRMPFLQVVGEAPTGKNFAVAFAFISDEKTKTYIWVMERLKRLFHQVRRVPGVIVTDRDLALVGAVEAIFPTVKHLLCRVHINKNVEGYAAQMTNKDIAKSFSRHWHRVVYSPTIEAFVENKKKMEETWNKRLPALINYVNQTWLNPYAERFVAAYTDDVLHFGNNSTNRVESAHHAMKTFIESSIGDFDTVFRKIHSMVEYQLEKLKFDLEQSRTRRPRVHIKKVFSRLPERITGYAFELMRKELERASEVGNDELLCGCFLRKTHGLPCSHELVQHIKAQTSIPLEDIHVFWRTFDEIPVDGAHTGDATVNHLGELEEIFGAIRIRPEENMIWLKD